MESQRIYEAVHTVMKSRIICMYKQCRESLTYKHHLESSLYIILPKLELNQRKALSGPDNITAAGLSTINDMTELVKSDQLALTNSEKRNCFTELKVWPAILNLSTTSIV